MYEIQNIIDICHIEYLAYNLGTPQSTLKENVNTMREKISVPAFVFKPVRSNNITTETIKRQDDILEIDFPVFDKKEVLEFAAQLAKKKRRAHDRPIDDLIEILDVVGKNWLDRNYEFRKEALNIVPMITGQSRRLCELELDGSVQFYNRGVIENVLMNELGGKVYLDQWVPKGNIKLHAQPRGVLYHNLAGNTFNVGLVSLYYGLIAKNVNFIKLPHEEPYFAVRLAESIADVDKKLAQEMAVLYWSGSRGDIFDELFGSGNINAVLGWGGLRSIEDIRRRAYQYGIKIVDHGPKLSFSVISEEILSDQELMQKAAQKIATDIVFWNQKACLSPRVLFIRERPRSSAVGSTDPIIDSDVKAELMDILGTPNIQNEYFDAEIGKQNSDNFAELMKRSAKLLRNEVTDLSPLGFARVMAQEMDMADKMLPRAHLTQTDGMEMLKKREFFSLKYEVRNEAQIFTPPQNKLNWTVVYMRNPPTLQEIQLCQDRFLIVTRISQLEDLIHFIRSQQLQKYLQTISVYGSNKFVENVAEEFSLLGACRFPRAGEHNLQSMGAPWDGHFILQNLIRWSFIGFHSLEATEEEKKNSIDLKSSNIDV